jgi:hypothetical protein
MRCYFRVIACLHFSFLFGLQYVTHYKGKYINIREKGNSGVSVHYYLLAQREDIHIRMCKVSNKNK